MSLTHLTEGDALPPLHPGVLRLYSCRICPYAQRPRIVLASKNIKHEVVNIHLKKKPEWLIEKNALSKVPILEMNDLILIESEVICDYLNEVHPDPPLCSSDAAKKAQDRCLVSFFDAKVMKPFFGLIFGKDDKTEAIQQVLSGLDIFEQKLNKRDTTTFLGGDSLGMADIMIWPFVERLLAFPLFSGLEVKIPSDDQPVLRRWIKAMIDHPAVQESYMSPEAHYKYFLSRMAGEPKYDG